LQWQEVRYLLYCIFYLILKELKPDGNIKNNISNAGVVKKQEKRVQDHMFCTHNGIPASRTYFPDGKRKIAV
jgi:hypothetical protein